MDNYINIYHNYCRPGLTTPDAEWTLFLYEKGELIDVQAWSTTAKAKDALKRMGYKFRVEWSRIFSGECKTVYI